MATGTLSYVKYSVYRQAFNWNGQAFAPKLVKSFDLRSKADALIRRLNNSGTNSDYYYLYGVREERCAV